MLHLPLLIVSKAHLAVVALLHVGEDGLVVERERLRAGELEPAIVQIADLAACHMLLVHRHGRRELDAHFAEHIAVQRLLREVEQRPARDVIPAHRRPAVLEPIGILQEDAASVVVVAFDLAAALVDLALQGLGRLDLLRLAQDKALGADGELQHLDVVDRGDIPRDAESVEPEERDDGAAEQTGEQGFQPAFAGKGAEGLADNHLGEEIADDGADEREDQMQREEARPLRAAAVKAEAAEEKEHEKREAEAEEHRDDILEDRAQDAEGSRLLRALVLPPQEEPQRERREDHADDEIADHPAPADEAERFAVRAEALPGLRHQAHDGRERVQPFEAVCAVHDAVGIARDEAAEHHIQRAAREVQEQIQRRNDEHMAREHDAEGS